MKKKLIILLVLFLTVTLFAVPPHPDVVNSYKKNGNLPQLSSRLKSMQDRGINKADKVFPPTGNNKVLVILIGYSDSSFDSGSTSAFYDTLFTGVSTSSLSWRKYYYDMSGGDLDLDFTVVGPYTASNTLAYYGQNDANGNDMYPGHLVGEAVDAAESDGIDFSEFDNDGDGNMDAVIIIHAGRGEETYSGANSAIWSHRWSLASSGAGTRTYDGVTINDYAIQPEYNFTAGDTTIGVFCHEFGHVLGLPDLYDVTYTTDGVGDWSLMAGGSYNGPGNNGSVPAPLLAWEKQVLGWADVTVAYNSEKVNSNNFYAFKNIILEKLKNNKKIIVYANSGIFGFILLLSIILNFIFGKNKKITGILIPLFFCVMMPLFFFNFTACPVEEPDEKPGSEPKKEKPNLKPMSLTIPSSAARLTGITIDIEVENTGEEDAGAFTTVVYLSTNNIISGTDTIIDTISHSGITAQNNTTESITYTLPDLTGTYYIGYIVDSGAAVTESNESDNTTSGELVKQIEITQGPKPNLKPVSVTVPSSGTQGEDISISVSIENDGDADAGAFITRVYLSSNNLITSMDTLIDTIDYTGINAHSDITDEFMYTLPTFEGTYYIGFIIDPLNTVDEENESDNTTSGSVVDSIQISVPLINASLEDVDLNNKALKISTGYSRSGGEQYYLIENKVQKSGTWSEYLPGQGLLIVLIDEYIIDQIQLQDSQGNTITGTIDVNMVNSLTTGAGTGWMHGVTVMESDNNNSLWTRGGDTGSSTDTYYQGNSYSNDLKRNNYTGATSGTKLGINSGVKIYNISTTGSTMTFDYAKP